MSWLVESLRVVGIASAVLLIAAGLGHVRGRSQVAATLAAHGVVAQGLVPRVARWLGPSELVFGGLALAGALSGQVLVVAVGGQLCTLLLAAVTGYLGHVWMRQRGAAAVPSGALGQDALTGWTVARAGLLTVGALALVGTAGDRVALPSIAAGLGCAGILWLLPRLTGRSPSAGSAV